MHKVDRLIGPSMILLLVYGVIGAAAVAAESPARSTSGFVVIGVAEIPEYEGADEPRTVPFVVSRSSLWGNEFEIDGLQARYDVVRHPVWRAGPALSVTIPRGDSAESVPVAQLPSIDLAVELGAFAGFRMPFSSAKEGALSGYVLARRDFTGVHDGWLLTADLEYFFAAARALRFGVAVNATYADDNYADTYFAVTPISATQSGLPSFAAGGGLKDVGLELFSIVSFSEQSGVFLRTAVNRLYGDFADSPIVAVEGNDEQWFYGVGYFRRF